MSQPPLTEHPSAVPLNQDRVARRWGISSADHSCEAQVLDELANPEGTPTVATMPRGYAMALRQVLLKPLDDGFIQSGDRNAPLAGPYQKMGR